MKTEQQKRDAQACTNKNSGKSNSPTNDPTVRCEQAKACELSSITIKVGGKDRSFELTVPGKPNRDEKDYVIQTISKTEKPTIAKINFRGTCSHGKPNTSALSKQAENNQRPNFSQACPTVKVSGYQVNVQQPNELLVQVYPKLEREDDSWLGFVQHYLFPTLTPSVYTVQSSKCTGGDGNLKAQIEAFPPFSVSGKIGVSYKEQTDQSKSPTRNRTTTRLVDEKVWTLEGEIACKVDGRNWKLSYEKEQTEKITGRPPAQAPFQSLRDSLGSLLKFLDEVNREYKDFKKAITGRQNAKADRDYKVEIQYPSASIEVDTKLVEISDGYQVDIESTVKISTTIINASIQFDILSVLLKRGGPYAEFLEYVREIAGEGIDTKKIKAKADIGLQITIAGGIAGELAFTKPLGKPSSPSGEISGSIGFNAEGFAEVEGQFFIVKISAGIRAELQSAESQTEAAQISATVTTKWDSEKQKGDYEGSISGNGLAIYFSAFTKVAVTKVLNKPTEPSRNSSRQNKTKTKTNARKELKTDGRYVLIDSWEWPGKSKTLQQAI